MVWKPINVSVIIFVYTFAYHFPALVDYGNKTDKEELYLKLAAKYKECMHDMNGRAPGMTCMGSVHQLKPSVPKGYQIVFNPR